MKSFALLALFIVIAYIGFVLGAHLQNKKVNINSILPAASAKKQSVSTKNIYQNNINTDYTDSADATSIDNSSYGVMSQYGLIATINSPITGLLYELQSVQPQPNGEIKVYWSIKNTTSHDIKITPQLKYQLSPRKLALVDFKYMNRFSLLYDDYVPRENCMIGQYIFAGGRSFCSAVVGPIYSSNARLRDNRVLVYMPGLRTKPIKIFLDII